MWSSVLFNSQDLTTIAGVNIEKVQFHNRGRRKSARKKLARTHGSKLITALYDEKEIFIKGVINGTSKSAFEQNRDTFFRYLDPVEATLRVPQAGGNRDYVATVDDVSWDEDPMGGFGKFTVRFVCSKPFGLDTSLTTAFNATGKTTATFTQTFAPAIGGSIECLAIITVTLSAVSGGTSKYIKITDPATSRYIQIARTWSAADVLIVDASLNTVKVNGTSVDFTGNLLKLRVGSTQLQYDDNFTTSRTVAMKLEYKKRYL